jgi:hypothetical protein
MIKCTECGYENMDGLELCDSCGGKLSPAAAPATDAAAPTPSASETPSAEVPPAAPAQSAPAADAPTGELAKPADAGAPATPLQPPAAAAAMVRAKLVIARGGRQGHEFPLEAGNNLIGRWDPETGSFPEVDLEQDDPEAKISRKHALIRIDGANVTVEDIGSLNGTYVNRGQRLTPGAPANLKTGDEIIVGKTFFKVSIDPIS